MLYKNDHITCPDGTFARVANIFRQDDKTWYEIVHDDGRKITGSAKSLLDMGYGREIPLNRCRRCNWLKPNTACPNPFCPTPDFDNMTVRELSTVLSGMTLEAGCMKGRYVVRLQDENNEMWGSGPTLNAALTNAWEFKR